MAVAQNPVGGASAHEITSALAEVMASLDHLAEKCRNEGIDPMNLLMASLSGGEAVPPTRALDNDAPSDAWIIERSHALLDAFDRYDVAAAAATLAPSFVQLADGVVIDRDALLMRLMQRAPDGPEVATRTWKRSRVVRKDDVLVFIGKAHEIQAGNDIKGGYVYDGWYVVQWMPSSDGWRVQLLNWQDERTERDWFDATYLKGRGFSRDPNHLLVETVADVLPGHALDLAMGEGRNALHLASRGWLVTGVDASEIALRMARDQAAERGLAIETIAADLDAWDFGVDRFDLVTLIYAGDHGRWIDKIKTSLRVGGLVVIEGWARTPSSGTVGFIEGQLAALFDGYEILRDERVEDVPDWTSDKGQLVRFVACKR